MSHITNGRTDGSLEDREDQDNINTLKHQQRLPGLSLTSTAPLIHHDYPCAMFFLRQSNWQQMGDLHVSVAGRLFRSVRLYTIVCCRCRFFGVWGVLLERLPFYTFYTLIFSTTNFFSVSKNNRSDALDELGLKRYCCRRMMLTHVDLVEKLLNYNVDAPDPDEESLS